ncbi:MAG: cysteine hydrolase [Clostridiales bacterium]|nr:cysteine hydrolase [Clostridiales bacterium]
MSKILVVIDMQEDFISGALGTEEAEAIVTHVRALIAEFRAERAQIYYTMDTHEVIEGGAALSQESIRVPSHCIKGTDGWAIVYSLTPEENDILVEKPDFLALGLPDVIGDLDPDTEIVLCGVCTDICVVSNALYLRARYPANRISVRKECCAGTTWGNHEAAIFVMESCLIDVI